MISSRTYDLAVLAMLFGPLIGLSIYAAFDAWLTVRNERQLSAEIAAHRAFRWIRFQPSYRERLARFSEDCQ